MRIVLLSLGFVYYDISLANALSRLEDVMLIVPKHKLDGFIENVEVNTNLKIYHQPRFRNPMNLVTVYKIIKQINDFKPDVIHLLGGHHPWFNLILPLLRREYALVTTVHDIKVHIGDKSSGKIPLFIFSLAVRYANRVIVHGEKLKRIMKERDNKSLGRIHVIPHGDFSFYKKFTRRVVNEEDGLVLFFGRIWEYKGLRYLIEAEPLISEKVPTGKIMIAGKGENFRKYQEMIVHKEKFIIYNQFIPYEKVPELFQRASIVVLPYIEASQSGVVPLAYTFKKPVVVTDVGSISEVVDNGKTGYIVPPKDPKKLAEAIIDLLKDKEKRKKMGENGYKKTENELSWDNIALKTVEVYKKAVSDKFLSNARRKLV